MTALRSKLWCCAILMVAAGCSQHADITYFNNFTGVCKCATNVEYRADGRTLYYKAIGIITNTESITSEMRDCEVQWDPDGRPHRMKNDQLIFTDEELNTICSLWGTNWIGAKNQVFGSRPPTGGEGAWIFSITKSNVVEYGFIRPDHTKEGWNAE